MMKKMPLQKELNIVDREDNYLRFFFIKALVSL